VYFNFEIFFHIALFVSGAIACWGVNNFGQLGVDSVQNLGSPGTLSSLGPIQFSDSFPAIEISLQANHACALFTNRRVRCWGHNAHEQLGDTTTLNRGSGRGALSVSSSVFVTFAAAINTVPIVAVSVGGYFHVHFHTINIYTTIFFYVIIYYKVIFKK
jgi:alpha-tubulin suppressor-like RCC1 family protein